MAQALYFPTTVLMGAGSIQLIPDEIKKLKVKKALVVTDEILVSVGIVDKVLNVLKESHIDYTVFSNVKQNPTIANVNEGYEFLKDNTCDFIISIGGGSPQDTAKAVAILGTNPGNIADYNGVNKTKNKSLPIVAINTTAGTASEATINYVITDETRKLKMVIVDTNCIATVAVNDADLMVNMPKGLTAATGMDALTHAIEGYITNGATPFTDMFNLEAIKVISRNLKNAVENGDDIESREGMAYGQFVTGMGFSNAGLGIVHSMAHQLGGYFDLPHGVCNAILLPYVMEYNACKAGSKYGAIAEAMGIDTSKMSNESKISSCIDAVQSLSKSVGIPVDFETMVKNRDYVTELAEHAIEDACTPGNPKEPTVEDIIELYNKVIF